MDNVSVPRPSACPAPCRPPPDPVNILLSFGYTIPLNTLLGQVEQAALDPYLGALHAPEHGRPSLPLDLMEEFRPVLVDAVVLNVLNHKAIGPRDFVPTEAAAAPVEEAWAREEAGDSGEAPRRTLLLRPEAATCWITAMERRLGERAWYAPRQERLSYRQILREQVYSFARFLKGEDKYRPFDYRP